MTRAFVAGLALVWIPFARVLFDSSVTLLYRDLTNVYLPAKALWLKAMVELGRLPHWNPYFASGVPFLSDPTTGMLNPANLLLLLAPSRPERGLIFFLLFQIFLIYAGAYLLCRSQRVRPWLSTLSGLTLAWSGYSFSCLSNPHDLAAIAAVPFFFFFIGKRRPSMAGCAAALAYPVLTGDVQFTYLMVLLSAALYGRRNPSFLLRTYLTALLLSAPQLLPTLAHFNETTRSNLHLAAGEQLTWSLHPARLLEFFFPQPFGSRPNYGSYLGYPFTSGQFRMDPFVFSFYPGLFTVAYLAFYGAATLSCARRVKRTIRPAFLGYLLLLLLTLGTYGPLAAPAARWIPLWGAFRYPERLGFWLAFFAWLAAARGSERVWRLVARGTKPSKFIYAAYSLPALWVSWWSSKAGFPAALISLGCFFLLIVALELGALRPRSMRWAFALAAGALTLEAGLVAERLVWVMPADIAQAGFSAVQRKVLKDRAENAASFARGGAFRLYALGQRVVNEDLPEEIAARERYGSMEREIRKAWAYLCFYSGATFGIELAHRQNTLVPMHAIYQLEKVSPRSLNRFLDLASVRYLVLENEIQPDHPL